MCSNWFLQSKNPVHQIWFFQLDFPKFKYKSTGGQHFQGYRNLFIPVILTTTLCHQVSQWLNWYKQKLEGHSFLAKLTFGKPTTNWFFKTFSCNSIFFYQFYFTAFNPLLYKQKKNIEYIFLYILIYEWTIVITNQSLVGQIGNT